jgi:Flp pilus assembly protein CpaB
MQFAQRLLSTRGGTVAVSVVAAVLAAIILIAYLHRYRESVRESGVPVSVLVAKGLIEKGTSGDVIANQELYSVSSVPKADAHDGAITDPAALKDRVASADIFPGEQLTTGKLSASATDSLANRITEDERAVSLPFDTIRGMISQVEAGDHVDIYGSFNVRQVKADGTPAQTGGERPVLKLLVENALVLAAPKSSSNGLAGNSGKPQLTIRLSDPDAAKVAFSADNGVLWVTLRPRANSAATSPDIVSMETVLLGVPPVVVYRSLGGKR